MESAINKNCLWVVPAIRRLYSLEMCLYTKNMKFKATLHNCCYIALRQLHSWVLFHFLARRQYCKKYATTGCKSFLPTYLVILCSDTLTNGRWCFQLYIGFVFKMILSAKVWNIWLPWLLQHIPYCPTLLCPWNKQEICIAVDECVLL